SRIIPLRLQRVCQTNLVSWLACRLVLASSCLCCSVSFSVCGNIVRLVLAALWARGKVTALANRGDRELARMGQFGLVNVRLVSELLLRRDLGTSQREGWNFSKGSMRGRRILMIWSAVRQESILETIPECREMRSETKSLGRRPDG
ncbi:MAG: hypothetical protein M1830_007612, partial [Pleopsidium flavum]